ncbi:MAG: homocysteine S-methyltransferase family protein [Woeseiaceae bacterium]|jgi:S-methylmethionine-dependent homocysteine/selenocysteine methylase
MSLYRDNLPQLSDQVFLTDGGLETVLIFHDGIDLPCFASFVLVNDEQGRKALVDYYDKYLPIACESGHGFVLETPTWRANRDWGKKLGYTSEQLAAANRESVQLMEDVRRRHATNGCPIVISGNIGPRGDGYLASTLMTAEEATAYHGEQVDIFADTACDVVTALTMTYAEEAIGITRAAQNAGIPVVVSFTTETDGRLPSGQALENAIRQVDEATGNGPAYYMVNCAHVDHFSDALAEEQDWARRVRGIRANASRCSHAELNEATELDDGDPKEFGRLYKGLRERLPALSIFGGCCGTDHRHVIEVATSIA